MIQTLFLPQPLESSQSLLPSANSYSGYGAIRTEDGLPFRCLGNPSGLAALVCSAPGRFNYRGMRGRVMTVLACVNTSKQAGDAEQIKVFANY
jgi:hypothetical protein